MAERSCRPSYRDMTPDVPPGEGPHRSPAPGSCRVPQPDYQQGAPRDLIQPRRLPNPIKASKNHQDLHRELLVSYRRGPDGGAVKPELQRALESRRRDQLMKQRKQEEEARRKISPLEQELLRRHQQLEQLERQQEQQQKLQAPEFIRVRENLRRTSSSSQQEKEV